MEDTLKLMEEQIKALRELVSIKDQTITELQKKPLIPQVQYVHHTYPNYQYQNPYWGYQIYGGSAISGISGQLNLGAISSGMNQGANTGLVPNTSLFSTTY